MGKKYNGHDSYNAWNVSLWIGNDEGLYNMARHHCRHNTRLEAADAILDELNECGITHTPDGVRYTKTNILKALRGL